jgi:hypothetical protein
MDRYSERIFEWVHEGVRDHTRDELCATLQELGIEAQMSEGGRPEEEITHRWFESLSGGVKSLGIIDIQNPVINWVGINKRKDSDGCKDYEIVYGIPCELHFPDSDKVRIRTKHIKRPIAFGKCIDLQWTGKDFNLGLIYQLNNDILLKRPLMDIKEDLYIRYYLFIGCWVLTIRRVDLSADLWECYQAIATHLIHKRSS